MPTRVIKPAHKCQTPIEALQLAEDLERIRTALAAVKRIAPENVTKDRSDGEDYLRIIRTYLYSFQRYAEHRLRNEFLSEEK